MKHFPRVQLARTTADAILGNGLFGDGPNGLFLAAPRRTGKSTFLQLDLAPELTSRGIVVVYVDLWADRLRDPGSLIAEAIGNVVQAHLGVVSRMAKAARLDSVSVAGVMKIDTSAIGTPDGLTLTDALALLQRLAKKPVTLIVDEAQHALTSAAGENAMAALKAARDRLNGPDDVQLMLVMSGSDRDKLLRLVNTNGAPFFGSSVQRMPMLGDDFIAFVAALVERQRPALAPVDTKTLAAAFRRFGSRPQFLSSALADALSPLGDSSDVRFERQVLEAANRQQREDEAQMESDFLALRPIEQAVLWRLLEQGGRFRPYDAEALRFYRDKLGGPGKVTAQTAQAAVESIRDRTPALVWKSARGEYSVDDVSMHAWYAARVAAGKWPPGDAAAARAAPADARGADPLNAAPAAPASASARPRRAARQTPMKR